ncbi:MAG TPA: histidine kinase [Silvibacterium sp.]|nr:histidine kinase [Silvibacterium sp.]
MHPAIFLSGWALLGLLFSIQDYAMSRSWGYQANFLRLFLAEEAYFCLWGIISFAMWWMLWQALRNDRLRTILIWLVPVSLVVSILQVALWVAMFPHGVSPNPKWSYLHTLKIYLDEELINNLVIFWIAFCMFRGVGYYHKLREKEYTAMRLESELTNAQLRALRMQLNPHFLFNTMNSISGMMRSDVEAADLMLERMSSMLRMTLDRGDAKLIPLTDELEFIQIYLSIQKIRFQTIVHHYVAIEPEVLDAQVPAMILQPLVENAYLHGVAKTQGEAFLGIEAQNHQGRLRLCVRNSGRGLRPGIDEKKGVGIANVKARLALHYGIAQCFELNEYPDGEVHATLMLPLQFRPRLSGSSIGYDNDTQNNNRR